jgi:hypothetical protein
MKLTLRSLQISILAALFGLGALLHADASSAGAGNAATVVELSGDVFFSGADGSLQKVELGQLFAEGDHLLTKEASSLHLVLADGSSLVLGPLTEVTLSKLGDGSAQSQSVFELLKGAVNAIVEKLTVGATFEVHTSDAVAAVKGTDFEVSLETGQSSVSVGEGEVNMMDPQRRRVEAVPMGSRCLAGPGTLHSAFRMPERDFNAFRSRWERARMIHGQRQDLMKHFIKERRGRLKDLRKRREAARTWRARHPEGGARHQGASIEDRKRKARERFQKARDELKKERSGED